MLTNKDMKIEVVIPVYHTDEKLISLVEKLEIQTVPVDKIIVMHSHQELTGDSANLSDIKSAEIVDKVCETSKKVSVYHVDTSSFDHGKTRNDGVKNTSSDCEYVLLMTQDAVPENEFFVESLVKPFSDEKVGVSYGRQIAREDSTLAEKFTRQFNYPDEDKIKTVEDIGKIGIKAFFCSNVCAMYRKSVFEELGGFINKTIFNEDMVYANKLLKSGYKIAYASKATAYHTHNYSGMQQYKRNFDLAVSQVMNPQTFEGISSESEGIRYVKAAFLYFLKHKKPFDIIPFGINCVYKYLGFRKGKNIENLSKEEVYKCTSNPHFFNGLFENGDSIVKQVMAINGIVRE